ncbi:U11/U12 small nuclear ribonucleoprotein 25 kDa protein-like [Alnus glutinosa]|uniref:U11/U12 small nuclear ribonucleoprotein 25 kDa protein-like n=1 Tax=Alnus glutinosa TaxID=3517 RepID=UPI002D79F768|nr:U11/U12 small nuclear ribonucleoprotein 25 kDa protein-like [Alnus glutinosa]
MLTWPSISPMSVWKSLTYHRLPQQPLKLYVLKLDGSYFEVGVAKTATIAELKEAVEEVFSQLPRDTHINISWSHVWGHFCLCYKGRKLVDDKASVRLFGIKDDDQLCFVRHISINDGQEKEERPVKEPSANINSLCVEMVKTLIPEGW